MLPIEFVNIIHTLVLFYDEKHYTPEEFSEAVKNTLYKFVKEGYENGE